MKFSVLLSVYYKEKPEYLKKAIESILNQTLLPNQVVIVKDGRLTKELEDIIKYYEQKMPSKIKVYGYKENRGLGYALQKGIMKCDYEYVARMDSDDISVKDRFEKQIKYLEKHPNVDILGGYIQEYDEKMEKKVSIRKVPLSNKEVYNSIRRESPFNHCTVMLKKEAVIRSGNYLDEKIEDYKLLIRMCANNCNMQNISDILVNYRTGIEMYKRRTGIKYLKEMKKVEDMLLKYQFINKWQYFKNIVIRTISAMIPSKMKKNIYPKIVRKYYGKFY